MRSFVGLTLLAWSVGLVAADTTTVVAPVATSGSSCAAQAYVCELHFQSP